MDGRIGATALAALLLGASAAPARETLGIYQGWGAFVDHGRCFAIAEPARRGSRGARPSAAILAGPGGARQLAIHLRGPKQRGAPVLLTIGDRRFGLAAGGAGAWARDGRSDARIVAAIRGGDRMLVETRGRDGRATTDVYPLRGAASAIDAAALACLRPAKPR